MLAIISPAKNLNEKPQNLTNEFTLPDFLSDSKKLIKELKKLKPADIGDLMEINPKLSQLNYERFLNWGLPFTPENSKQAALLFSGEVYNGLKANTLSEEDLLYAQNHLRILSGLYGILRPLDLIQPYRLEMGRPLETPNGTGLYNFWGNKITNALNKYFENEEEKTLLNLASNEYFKSVNTKKLKAKVLTINFKEMKGDKLKTIVVYTKKARGMMVRFMLQNKINKPEDLKHFEEEGYFFNEPLSNETEWLFTR